MIHETVIGCFFLDSVVIQEATGVIFKWADEYRFPGRDGGEDEDRQDV